MSRRRKARMWFREAAPTKEVLMRHLARVFAEGDQDLAEDLYQEGMIAIYMMEPAELRAAEDAHEECVGRAVRMMYRYRARQRHGPPMGALRAEESRRMERQLRYLAPALEGGGETP